jgi:hypothetical protein
MVHARLKLGVVKRVHTRSVGRGALVGEIFHHAGSILVIRETTIQQSLARINYPVGVNIGTAKPPSLCLKVTWTACPTERSS